MQITVKAPAKINLALDILSKREDGFHEISTVMQSVSLCDRVTVRTNDSSDINILCENKKVPLDSSNLAYKAAKAYFERFAISGGVDIVIEKNIPIAAGLAGGSADAAAALLALSMLFEKGNGLELSEIAASLGSDVPFCLNGGTVLAIGTGTRLRRLHPMHHCEIVIAKPDIDISAGYAYSLFDEKNGRAAGRTFETVMALHGHDIKKVAASCFNCFEQVIHYDEIDNIKDIMLNNGGLCSVMSGSGSAVFGIFDDKNSAEQTCTMLRNAGFDSFLAHPTNDGCTVEL